MSSYLAHCLNAAAREVLRLHFYATCEPIEGQLPMAEPPLEYGQSFGGELQGSLILSVETPLASRLAQQYCPHPIDIPSAMRDLQRLVCGSVLHRFRPAAGVRFTDGHPPKDSSTEAENACVSLLLFDGAMHLRISLSDQDLRT
ncbi:MAG: hypothetical protein HY820_29380 [Acidobacteria bacterium]|nr:hypothetical protein [Acidobacteriota bacterium]